MRKRMHFWKRGRTWYFRPDGGKWRSTGESRRADAEDAAARLVSEQRGRSTATLRAYAGPFFVPDTCPHLRRRREEGRDIGDTHVQSSRRWIEMYLFPDPLADRPLAEIRRADVLDFRSRLLERLGTKKSTANKVMQTLKVILREALYREDIDRDPTAGIGLMKEDRRPPGIFDAAELRGLFPGSGLGPWGDLQEYACFLVAATTGMRRSEVLALTWEQLDLDAGAVRITRAWKSTRKLGPPKSGKPRACPLPSFTASVLIRLRDDTDNIRTHPTDLVFCYDDGTRLGVTWWADSFTKAMRRAGIDAKARRITPHSLRHTLNTLLEANDYNPEKIRAALGWSGEAIRGNYLHLSVEHLQEQAEIVDGLFRPTKHRRTSRPATN